MPQFRITAPDGATYDVTGPDGSTEQDALAQVMAQHQGAPSERDGVKFPVKFGAEGMQQSAADAAAGMDFGHQVIAGVGTGLDKAAMGLKRLFGNALSPEEQNRVETAKAAAKASGGVMAGQIGFDIGATAPIAPASLVGNVALGAGMGALDPTGDIGSNMKSGAVGGSLGYGLVKGAQKLLGGLIPQTPNVQKLIEEGIIPTPGAAARDTKTLTGRVLGNAEDAAGSLPIVGQVISGARERNQLELARAALRRATAKGYDLKGATGTQGVERAQAAVSDLYDKATTMIPAVIPDNAFAIALKDSMRKHGMGMSKDEMQQAAQSINSIVADKLANGQGSVTGEVAKDISSQLGELAVGHGKQGNAFISEFVKDAQTAWKQLIARNAPPQAAAALKEADRAYANLVRVEGAVNRGRRSDGAFTGGQLMDSVYATDKTVRHRASAGGDALMQDLAQPAAAVLPSRLADSGTATRGLHAMALAGLGGGAAANEYYGGPGFLTAALLSPALYSRGGTRYLLGDLAGQGAVRKGIGLTAPYSGVVGSDLNRR